MTRQFLRIQFEEHEAIKNERDDEDVEHTAEQVETQHGEKKCFFPNAEARSNQRAQHRKRLRGHDRHQPRAVDSRFEGRLVFLQGHQCEEGVNQNEPEREADQPKDERDLLVG